MQRRLYINESHTALDIFRFAVFFLLIHYFLMSLSLESYGDPSIRDICKRMIMLVLSLIFNVLCIISQLYTSKDFTDEWIWIFFETMYTNVIDARKIWDLYKLLRCLMSWTLGKKIKSITSKHTVCIKCIHLNVCIT